MENFIFCVVSVRKKSKANALQLTLFIPTSYSQEYIWFCFFIRWYKVICWSYPLRILKDNKIFPQVLCKWINDSLKNGAFPTNPLKLPEITRIYKKEDRLDKGTHHTISILPSLPKVFKILYTVKFIVTSSSNPTGSWYSTRSFLIATGMAKGA